MWSAVWPNLMAIRWSGFFHVSWIIFRDFYRDILQYISASYVRILINFLGVGAFPMINWLGFGGDPGQDSRPFFIVQRNW